MGGRSDAAIRRAGRFGDGWFGVWVSARRYGEAVAQMNDVGGSTGPSGNARMNALNVWCGVADTADAARSYVAPAMEGFYQTPYERFEKWSPAGTVEQLAEFLVPYVDAGCSVFNLIISGASAEAEVAAAAEIRRRILAAAGASA